MNSSIILKNKITSIAIGGFDGIHVGHKALISKLDSNGALMIINKYQCSLTPGKYRCKFVDKPCFFYDLSTIKEYKAKEFAEFLKQEFPKLKKIIVGYDFKFGKDKCCEAKELNKFYQVEIIPAVEVDNISVHSGTIKELIKNGEIKQANKLLGRFYSIEGQIVCGQGIGKKQLVPTINTVVDDFLLPKKGVYATKIILGKETYKSVTFVGIRESTDGNFSVETHIIDSKIECKNKKAEIIFYERIRANKKFNCLEKLKEQILKDIKKSKEILHVY